MRSKLLTLALLGTTVWPLAGCAPAVVAGAGVGAVMADDRRTPSTFIMDQEIEMMAARRVDEARLANVHASFTSFNRRLLITGEVPNEDARAKVEELARSATNVRETINELAVAEPSSISARTNDTYITGKVKARFVDERNLDASHVKVVTERGVVYLMGLVRRSEADLAATVAAKTAGVAKVVKVFEYID